MRSFALVLSSAAALIWFAIGLDGQAPAAQAPPAATASGAAPSAQNTAPTVSLVTLPARQVYGVGERFTVVATTSDDTDPPDRLQYRWTVKNLESGVEQAARSTGLQQVSTSGRTAGKYEYKCIVTDSAGLTSEASLLISIEDIGNPEIVGLAFDDSTAAIQRATLYWQVGIPAIRRGDWALMLVSVRNFIAGPYFLRVIVDGKAVAPGGAGAAWAVQNLGGNTTEQQVRLFVPSDTAIGKHTIEVAVIKRAEGGAAESEIGRMAFQPEPLVLFNPWKAPMPDPSVHANQPLSNTRATFYTRGTQDFIMGGLASKTVYDVSPYEKSIVGLAQEIVASMPPDARGDGSRVASAMAAYVSGQMQQGKWPSPNASLTGLLRSVGIPARSITVLGAGRDLEAEWAVLQTKYDCRKWSGTRCDEPAPGSAREQLSFRAWNEVWLPALGDGWSAVDATPQSRHSGGQSHVGATNLKAVRDFPAPQRGQQIPNADDAAFLYEQTNLPWEISWKAQDGNWYQAAGESGSATHAFVADATIDRSNEVLTYGVAPAGLADTRNGSAVQISVGPLVNLRTNATIRISVNGLSATAQRLGVAVLHLPRELSSDSTPKTPPPGGLVFATVLDVRSSAGSWTGTVEVPGDALWAAGPYEIAVGPQQGTAGPSGRMRFDVRSLPIAVALPARVNVGTPFAVSARLINTSSTPVQGATLRLVLPNQFRVLSGTGSSALGVIPPGGDLRVDAMVQATTGGTFLVGAASEGSAGPGEEHVSVLASQPGRLFVAGEPAVGVKPGETVTVAANVILDAVEPSVNLDAQLVSNAGAALSVIGEVRKLNDAIAPDDLWTPSWQVLVNSPGVYRLPVRVKGDGLGEATGEILLVAGGTDPDAGMTDDFNDESSLGYRSAKAIAGVIAVILAIVGGAAYWLRRRARRV